MKDNNDKEYFCQICQEVTPHLQDGFCEKCQLTKEEQDEYDTPDGYVYNGIIMENEDH